MVCLDELVGEDDVPRRALIVARCKAIIADGGTRTSHANTCLKTRGSHPRHNAAGLPVTVGFCRRTTRTSSTTAKPPIATTKTPPLAPDAMVAFVAVARINRPTAARTTGSSRARGRPLAVGGWAGASSVLLAMDEGATS